MGRKYSLPGERGQVKKFLRTLLGPNYNLKPYFTVWGTWFTLLVGGAAGMTLTACFLDESTPWTRDWAAVGVMAAYFAFLTWMERRGLRKLAAYVKMVEEAQYMNKLWDNGINVQDGFDIKTFDITTHEGRPTTA